MNSFFTRSALLVLVASCGNAAPVSLSEEGAPPREVGTGEAPFLVSGCLPVDLEMETLVTLNLRAEPSTDASILLEMPHLAHPVTLAEGGTDVSCEREGWLRLSYGEHEGWAFADYLVRADICTTGTVEDEGVRKVISDTFGPHASEALEVARCESGPWGTEAQNGQYLGLFQMGSNERATYGHHGCAEGQARAAERYFTATNKTWSPWACKP